MDCTFIDAHVHLHRDAETERKSMPLPGRRDRDRWGNPEALIPYLDREGGTHAVALNLFPTPVMRNVMRAKLDQSLSDSARASEEAAIEIDLKNRLRRHNEWLCGVSQAQPRIIAGIGIQKLLSSDEMVEEVETRVATGAPTLLRATATNSAGRPALRDARRCEKKRTISPR